MKRKFRLEYSEVVYYESVEIEADTEDEAEQILQEMIDKDDVTISDREYNDLQIEDIGE